MRQGGFLLVNVQGVSQLLRTDSSSSHTFILKNTLLQVHVLNIIEGGMQTTDMRRGPSG